MTPQADPSDDDDAHSTLASPRHSRRRGLIVTGAKIVAALVSAVVVGAAGIAWFTYRNATDGITRSEALADEPAPAGSDLDSQNILIMGLDSRRDQRGQPLPKDIYNALHAGDEDSGDGGADALIVVHLPAGNGPATAISIPRDDYVDLAGCPNSGCRGKIRDAYSLAYQRVLNGPSSANWRDSATKEQQAREAGRKAQISTIKRLLQIPIDHFVEVTLAGFLQIARVVEPITVCLTEDTSDRYYSGAQFHKGTQQISAAQAMAFVRQRRDGNDAVFTDLDRTRRQQAFIVSLMNALRRGDPWAMPGRVRGLLDVAKQYVAVDSGLDLEGFVRNASALLTRPVRLFTLPVTGFGETSDGASVNYIDVSAIRSLVRSLMTDDSPVATPSASVAVTTQPAHGPHTTAGNSVTLDVVNASGRQGMAADLEKSLATGHFTQGAVSTADSLSQTSSIAYGPGAKAAAAELADDLGISAVESISVAPNTVRLTVGTDYSNFYNLTHTPETSEMTTTTTTTAPVTTLPAAGTGTRAPTPADLTRMTADAIPCVK